MSDSAYFITATGTDIGKTYVTALMVRLLRSLGKSAQACKPVMSGVSTLEETDAACLLRAMGYEHITEIAVNTISPYRFIRPLSPHRAAELESRMLPVGDMINWCRSWLAMQQGVSFIEGVGGVKVPLTRQLTVMDWMRELELPVILVTGDYLGTLSHTFTALECLQAAKLRLAAVIVNESPHSVEHADACRTIKEFNPYDVPVLSLRHQADRQIGNDNRKDDPPDDWWNEFFSFVSRL